MEDATQLARCRQCGAELPPERHDGLCPSCLMAAVAASGSQLTGDELTTLGQRPERSSADPTQTRLTPGQTFGPYRIGRLLGRGGMGEVYEAEHLEHGRRVALKVLNRRLAGPEDRARFLREGQLAASVTHPNTVYIFGSEEIAGTPVIAMELVAGGTLKDRVAGAGPLTPPQAVDAVLDLAAGLDAARAGGVLHRDIKPSNCFVEADGRVKIGDFGLSISTIARDVAHRGPYGHVQQPGGSFEGTPQYAAPEQLRGQSLDVRADIYAVGATLYYLLTGRPPFDDRDLQTLVARVGEESPAFPTDRRRRIPSALAAIVLRCLAKDRADRPSTYAELEDLLRPFSSTASTPANPGLRFIAGVLDKLLLTLLTAPLTIVPKLEFVQPATVNFGVNYADASGTDASLFARVAFCTLTILYYTLLEGLTGASIGKRLCNLRVAARGQHPGIARAFVRTIVFMLPVWWGYLGLELWAVGDLQKSNPTIWLVAAMFLTTFVVNAVLFTSMRRRNGYAAWHDLATGTRVIVRRRDQSRPAAHVFDQAAAVATHPLRRLGPFEVSQSLGSTASGELFAGFDPVLRRTVWLHELPKNAAPLTAAWRDLARPGRQRWLHGRRTADEAWDAYEAPDGAPLTVVTQTRQPWRVVRLWLQDLAREIEAARRDGTLPPLSLDRVWITRSSRAMLVDLQPTTANAPTPALTASPQQFLAAVAASSLTADPLPLPARTTIDAMAREGEPRDGLTSRVDAIAAGLDQITSWRRGVSIGLANAPVVLTILAVLALVPIVSRVVQPEFLLPINCLIEINKLEAAGDSSTLPLRGSLGTYCSATYGATFRNESFWRDPRARQLTAPLHPVAERVLASYPSVTPADAALAADASRTVLDEAGARSGAATGLAITMALPSSVLLLCAVLAVLSSVLVRGGILMRLLGLAVVDRRGQLVPRWLSLCRALVAWSPTLIMWTWFGISIALDRPFEQTFSAVWLVAATFAVSCVGAVWTIAHPAHSWQDRLTRTWVVPR